jgi:hypothetical protein
MCEIIQMSPKSKPKAKLAEEKLVEIWCKIGISSLVFQDGRQVEVHDGKFVVTAAETGSPAAGQGGSMPGGNARRSLHTRVGFGRDSRKEVRPSASSL